MAAGASSEQEGPYLYQPSEARSARVIKRAASPTQSESSAFSRCDTCHMALHAA